MEEPSSTSISPKEAAAIIVATRLSERIIEEHPGIAIDYQAGRTVKQIAEQCGLLNDNQVGVARTAVRMALKALLSTEELDETSKEHIRNNGYRAATTHYQCGTGFFGLDDEAKKRRAANSLATQVREKIGIHGLSDSEKAEAHRRGSVARGFVPWTGRRDPETGLEELEYALKLFTDPEFIHREGKLRNTQMLKK